MDHESYAEYFSGRRVLITGAGKGLGYALVKKFYENNALVFALDKKQAYLDSLKEEFPNVKVICVDLRDWDETRRLVKSIAPIDHLVNNAGLSDTSFFEDIAPEQIDGLFSVNFKAVVNVSQTVAKGLIQHERSQGGTIVNISSVFDTIPSKGISMYSCSKAAILMLTKCMALELGDKGIRVNSISPAPTALDKEMFISTNSAIVQETHKVLDRQVLKRPVQASEAANIVIFLSSPNSAMITGTCLPIDGGMFSR